MKKTFLATASAIVFSILPIFGAASSDELSAAKATVQFYDTILERSEELGKREYLKKIYEEYRSFIQELPILESDPQKLSNKQFERAAYVGLNLPNLYKSMSTKPNQEGFNAALKAAVCSPDQRKAFNISFLLDPSSFFETSQPESEFPSSLDQKTINDALVNLIVLSQHNLSTNQKIIETILSGITILMSPLICTPLPDKRTIIQCVQFLEKNHGAHTQRALDILFPPLFRGVFDFGSEGHIEELNALEYKPTFY